MDGLKPSEYLVQTAKQNIEGDITIEEAKQLIDSYYQSASNRHDVENDRTEEADKVSARIAEILSEQTFNFSPAQLTSIHRRLFEGIYRHPAPDAFLRQSMADTRFLRREHQDHSGIYDKVPENAGIQRS